MSDLPETLTINLATPVDVDGGQVTKLELREPLAVQVASADKETNRGITQAAARRRNFQMIALVAGVPMAAVRKLPISTIKQASAFLQAFVEADMDDTLPAVDDKTWDMPVTPFALAGVTYSTLRLREPTGAETEAAEEKLAAATTYALRQYQFTLVAACSGSPPEVAGRLKIRELNAAATFCQRFIAGGPATGES